MYSGNSLIGAIHVMSLWWVKATDAVATQTPYIFYTGYCGLDLVSIFFCHHMFYPRATLQLVGI